MSEEIIQALPWWKRIWLTPISALERHPGRLFVAVVGTGLVVDSASGPFGGDPYATAALATGALMVIAGSLTPYIKKITASPGKIQVDVRPASEVTSRLAADGPASTVREIQDTLSAHQSKAAEGVVDDVVRWLVAEAAAKSVLHPTSGPLLDCRLHVYIPDELVDSLVPVFEVDAERAYESWRPGVGVTGRAFRDGAYTVISGDDLRAPEMGLSKEQLQRYDHLEAVASAPIVGADGEILGVVSAATDNAGSDLMTDNGREDLMAVAACIGFVIQDVMGWFPR